MTFSAALQIFPHAVSLDFGYHKTIEDLRYAAQHELDLLNEGQENDLDTPQKVKEVVLFLRKTQGEQTPC